MSIDARDKKEIEELISMLASVCAWVEQNGNIDKLPEAPATWWKTRSPQAVLLATQREEERKRNLLKNARKKLSFEELQAIEDEAVKNAASYQDDVI